MNLLKQNVRISKLILLSLESIRNDYIAIEPYIMELYKLLEIKLDNKIIASEIFIIFKGLIQDDFSNPI